jgi:hypothetical protein
MTSSPFALEASSNKARVDLSLVDPSWVSLIPSALYSISVPSEVVVLAVNWSFWMRPPRTIASRAFLSSIWIAAIFSRGDTTGSSTTEPSRLLIVRVVPSLTMLVRTSTISATAHSFSRKAASRSPGTKKDVIPAPPPATKAWLSDFRTPNGIIGRSWSKVKPFSDDPACGGRDPC